MDSRLLLKDTEKIGVLIDSKTSPSKYYFFKMF